MNFQNKKIIKKLFIIITIFIIFFGIFYLYNYNNEKFTVINGIYTGEPSPSGDYTPSIDNTYVLPNLQAVTSNNIGLYGLDTNNTIYYYSLTNNIWTPFYINLSIPQITNPQYDNSTNNKIICKSSDGLQLASSLNTLWIYNNSINNVYKIDCIFFLSLNNDGSIATNANIYCLPLPLLTSRIIPTTTMNSSIPTTTYKAPLQPFDNIRLLAANRNVLFALGCYDASTSYNMQNNSSPSINDTGLYYYILNNSFPINNAAVNGWKSIGLPIFVIRSNIVKIVVNDSYIFINTSKYNQNAPSGQQYTYDIFYMPIVIQNNIINLTNWIKMTLPVELNKIYGISFQNLSVNNDILYGIEQDINNSKTNIWWYPLKNGGFSTSSDPSYTWKSISLSNFSTIDIVLYNNNFIVFGSDNISNYVIPLKGSFTPSATINYSTVVTSAGGTVVTSVGGTVVTSAGGTVVTSAGGTVVTSPGGSGGTTVTLSSIGNASNTPNASTGITGPNTTNGNTSITGPTTTNVSTSSTTSTSTSTTKPLATLNSLLSNLNLQASGNTDNLNDFMAKNTLIGSNIYLSPMNDTNLYMPTQNASNQKKSRNINSQFSPSVDFV